MAGGSSAAAALADDVEQCLALLDIDGVKGAGEGGRQFGRVLDPLAVAAGGSAHLLEGRQLVEVDERRAIAARCFALRVHAEGGSANLTPSAAPAPQPSPAAGLDPKKLPGRVDGQCSGSRVYSLTIADCGSRASARQALTQTGLIGRMSRASSRDLRQ